MLTKRIFIGLCVLVVALSAAVLIIPMTTAFCAAGVCQEKASGKGTLLQPDGTKREFSFNARKDASGDVIGSAEINNPAFNFTGLIEIKCLEVVGNRARAAGVVYDTNDPNLFNNTAVFEVYDKGNPGKDNDTISLVYFSPPNSPPPTEGYCQFFEDFPQMAIDKGNVKVDDCP